MGFATHLGPWLLGTVKNTTGTTPSTTRNTGCTVVSQSSPVVFGALTGTLFAIPAGSQIVDIKVLTTEEFSSATTIVLEAEGDPITTAGTITTIGSISLGAAFPAVWVNTDTTDKFITYVLTGTALTTGVATVIFTYAVRNSDGSQFQTASNN